MLRWISRCLLLDRNYIFSFSYVLYTFLSMLETITLIRLTMCRVSYFAILSGKIKITNQFYSNKQTFRFIYNSIIIFMNKSKLGQIQRLRRVGENDPDSKRMEEKTEKYDLIVLFNEDKIQIFYTYYQQKDFQKYQGIFTESDLPPGIIIYYGSFFSFFQNCFVKNKAYTIFSQGATGQCLEIPYVNYTENTRRKETAKLSLYSLQSKQENEEDKIGKLLDRRNKEKQKLTLELTEATKKLVNFEKQNEQLKRRVLEMEKLCSKVNVPIFYRTSDFDLIEMCEDPRKIKYVPYEQGMSPPAILFFRNEISKNKPFKLRVNFPPIEKVEEHSIGLVSEDRISRLVDTEEKIVYDFNGKLTYSYKSQVCEDMKVQKYTYITMLINLKEGFVKFEKGREIFATALLKVFNNKRFVPFIKVAQANTYYTFELS